ncbi:MULTISPECIES: PucR family transcriptional regulator [unclassified Nocardioides]|uniref:PucR family transcriptional regulator n=1 Tax=unclassified Nocardioides TaxID=2615069 RepID=UPI0006FBC08C|nr:MULTISPECIES: helix-turn-helix domain-containing protein [unclassified Nocardioides]KQY55511.1 hypothetical protein ASD30_16565 [Nocardioides sp. Root140]KQZ67174.1 hypothetical protein ASD66_19505 [Nocardioides sp. Root151]KRF12752.1 hypothetical protein ASH02_14560 [Nocardioides sp. Soil796]
MAADDTLARACARVAEDLDGLVGRVVSRIRSVVPAYSVVAYQEQFDYIRSEFATMLDCLARGAALPADLVEKTREVGKRRAQQGMTLQDVVQSYHLGLKEIWSSLVEQGGDAGPALLDASSYLWDNVHVLTSAVAVGHGEATRSAQAVRVGLRYRLLEALAQGSGSVGADLEGLANRLGFDVSGPFAAIVTSAAEWSEVDVESVQAVLERTHRGTDGHRGLVQCSRVGDLVITLTQHSASGRLVESLRGHRGAVSVGVGMPRSGLAGAAASIEDARLAARAAPAGSVAYFEDDWIAALLAAHPAQCRPLLAAGDAAAREQTHLADAVTAYAENGFSVSAAARALHLHANSVTYRLERWAQLTGWDPRTFDGLLRSVACLRTRSLPGSE